MTSKIAAKIALYVARAAAAGFILFTLFPSAHNHIWGLILAYIVYSIGTVDIAETLKTVIQAEGSLGTVQHVVMETESKLENHMRSIDARLARIERLNAAFNPKNL